MPLAALLFVAVAAFAYARPRAWLVALPAVIPLVGFAPWSGWITFEDVDALVLAMAAGVFLRQAVARPLGSQPLLSPPPGNGPAPPQALTWLFALLFAVSLGISCVRGVADAGGFAFDWFAGYHGPMNSLRLAKSFFLALLLLAMWNVAQRDAARLAPARLTTGLALGLAGASLAALWERLAFTGLLDFSTDYRTTALFWEMHVGGAAFDGFLALTVPFALRELQRAVTLQRTVLAVGCLLLASYACLTTFSRGVYLAVPLGVAVTLWLASRQARPGSGIVAKGSAHAWAAVGVALAYAAAAAWMFPTSGYRGMLALLGALAVLLRLGSTASRMAVSGWVNVVALGAGFAALAWAMAAWSPKAAYVAYAALLGLALVGTLPASRVAWLVPAAFIGAVASIGLVCMHWGGEAALWHSVPVMALLALAALSVVARGRAAWPGGSG